MCSSQQSNSSNIERARIDIADKKKADRRFCNRLHEVHAGLNGSPQRPQMMVVSASTFRLARMMKPHWHTAFFILPSELWLTTPS